MLGMNERERRARYERLNVNANVNSWFHWLGRH